MSRRIRLSATILRFTSRSNCRRTFLSAFRAGPNSHIQMMPSIAQTIQMCRSWSVSVCPPIYSLLSTVSYLQSPISRVSPGSVAYPEHQSRSDAGAGGKGSPAKLSPPGAVYRRERVRPRLVPSEGRSTKLSPIHLVHSVYLCCNIRYTQGDCKRKMKKRNYQTLIRYGMTLAVHLASLIPSIIKI